MKRGILLLVLTWVPWVHAEPSYTEKLREQIKKEDAEKAEKSEVKEDLSKDYKESYTEKLKKNLKETDAKKPSSGKSYIEELREKNPDLRPKSETESFTDKKKEEVAPTRSSSIDAIKSGKSDELVLKRPGTPRFFISLKVEVVGTRDFTTDPDFAGAAFMDVYSPKWRPDMHVNFEYQFLRRENGASLGVFVETGVASFVGKGQFPFSKGTFGSAAQTEFRIYTVPAFLGVTARLNALKYVRPYVSVGAGGMLFWETRDDDKDATRVYTLGMMGSGGVNILLDGLSDRASWTLYDNIGIKHYYLNLDFTYLNVTKGPVQHHGKLAFVGLSFEI